MRKIKAFHIINKGQKTGAKKIARLIKKTSSLKISEVAWFGKGAYAHYYKNINKPNFKEVPIVIFNVDKIRCKPKKPHKDISLEFILIEGKKGEDSVPIEIVEFKNVPVK